MLKRARRPPKFVCSLKASLDPALHSRVDASLKALRVCARRLQPVLSTLADEMQILQQLYYKGKNQHRTALFWRRVLEIKRYGERVQELELLSLVDSLRYSFFSQEIPQTSKSLKGSWTHYPDPVFVSFLMERIGSSLILAQKMHERLAHAYQSFVLAMQSGAFIQLILTLAGIASRMSSMVEELAEVLRATSEVVHPILIVLDPHASPATPRNALLADQPDAMQDLPANITVDVDDDIGVSVARLDPRERSPNQEKLETTVNEAARSITPSPGPGSIFNKPSKRPKTKKKRKLDEIDDIFG